MATIFGFKIGNIRLLTFNRPIGIQSELGIAIPISKRSIVMT